jgi:hypothetical protein
LAWFLHPDQHTPRPRSANTTAYRVVADAPNDYSDVSARLPVVRHGDCVDNSSLVIGDNMSLVYITQDADHQKIE